MIYTFDKNHPLFEDLAFVARAVAKRNDLKPYLEQINVTWTAVQATDAHRAHRFTPPDMPLPPGMYRIIKRTKPLLELALVESDTNYPNIDRVIPSAPALQPLGDGGVDLQYATVVRSISDPSAVISHRFFTDLFPSPLTDFSFPDGHSPLYVKGGACEAIIMPMRQN